MVPVRSLNEQWMYLGMPGTGKSWKARLDLWEMARTTGGYVIAHDPTDSFEDPGVDIPHRRYTDPGALVRGVQRDGGNCAHILDTNDGDLVLRCALALASASMARAPQQKGKFNPVFVYWDEAVAAGDMKSHHLSDLWMDALGRRRRYGICPVMTSQSAFFAHRSVLMLASKLYVFRLVDPADGDRLIKCGLPKADALKLASIPDRQFYCIEKGVVTARPHSAKASPAQAESTEDNSPQEP